MGEARAVRTFRTSRTAFFISASALLSHCLTNFVPKTDVGGNTIILSQCKTYKGSPLLDIV
jgi:hypothetical protein